jgi:hypothetical protein
VTIVDTIKVFIIWVLNYYFNGVFIIIILWGDEIQAN